MPEIDFGPEAFEEDYEDDLNGGELNEYGLMCLEQLTIVL